MGRNEYRRDLVRQIIVEQNGTNLLIKGAEYFPSKMDYSDEVRLKILATKAVHAANGFAELVSNNCNIKEPDASPEGHLEMYLSLAALACEIYMKSIIYNEGLNNGKMVKGHHLDELFAKMPESVHLTLNQKFPDIEKILYEVRDVFEKLRYDFEQFSIHGDYLVIFQLMNELKLISNAYPKRGTGSITIANGVMYLR